MGQKEKVVFHIGSCVFIAILALPSEARPLLRLAANYWEPYTGNSLVNNGIASEIVVTALNRAGYDVTIDIMPWKRVLAMTYNGSVDGVVAIWSTKERDSKLLFSSSYMSNELVLLYMPGVVREPKSLEELTGLTVGIGSGYDYSDEFLRHKNFKTEPVSNVIQNLLKLTIGRVDMVLEDRLIAKFAIKKYSINNKVLSRIVFSEKPIMYTPVYFAINPNVPNSRKIISEFNYQILTMRKDGTLIKILSNAALALP